MCTSIFVRFAGFDAVTLANNHLNDFGEKGVNFTFEVLKKTGVKYFGVTYGKYDTSQVSITCSDIQHWDKPKMLPISVKLLRRLYLYFEEIFCSVFTTLCGLLVSQIFVWGLRIRLPPPPPPPPPPPLPLISAPPSMSYFIGNLPWEPDCKNSSDFHIGSERALACKRAKERFGLGVKTENEFDENELVIRDVRLCWCTSFLPLVLPWILFMEWLFFSLFISLAKVLNLHYYFPSIAGSLSSFFII